MEIDFLNFSELNFDLGFIGLLILFGPPFFLIILGAWIIDKITDIIQSLRFKTDTSEGWMQETEYYYEKFEKKRRFEKRFPIYTKFKKVLLFTLFCVFVLVITFFWGWFLLTILE